MSNCVRVEQEEGGKGREGVGRDEGKEKQGRDGGNGTPYVSLNLLKLAVHDTDIDILAMILECRATSRSACHGNNFRKSRVSDVRM